MKFSIKDFFSKCDQIRRKLRIWSHLLKKSLMQNFIFSPVYIYFCYSEIFAEEAWYQFDYFIVLVPPVLLYGHC